MDLMSLARIQLSWEVSDPPSEAVVMCSEMIVTKQDQRSKRKHRVMAYGRMQYCRRGHVQE